MPPSGGEPYKLRYAPVAVEHLRGIGDERIKRSLKKRIRGLKTSPSDQGKALVRELAGLRSLPAVGRRYRIIYAVDERSQLVSIVCVGIRKDGDRKDIYEVAKHVIAELRSFLGRK